MAREGGNPGLIPGYKKDYYTDKVQPKWEMIATWARSGLSNNQIAKNLGIGGTTFVKFLELYEELADWVREAREDAEMIVENALFKRAIGYEVEEITRERRQVDDGHKMVVVKRVKKQIAADVGAAQYWLEHRAPNKWTRNPAPGVNTDQSNTKIYGLAMLIANPVPVREIGSENE